eukprot:123124-Prorocentrum_minimum.AAC.5
MLFDLSFFEFKVCNAICFSQTLSPSKCVSARVRRGPLAEIRLRRHSTDCLASAKRTGTRLTGNHVSSSNRATGSRCTAPTGTLI